MSGEDSEAAADPLVFEFRFDEPPEKCTSITRISEIGPACAGSSGIGTPLQSSSSKPPLDDESSIAVVIASPDVDDEDPDESLLVGVVVAEDPPGDCTPVESKLHAISVDAAMKRHCTGCDQRRATRAVAQASDRLLAAVGLDLDAGYDAGAAEGDQRDLLRGARLEAP